MKKLLSFLLFLVYFLTSIVYINLYEFKNVRNMLWKDNKISYFYIKNIKSTSSIEKVIKMLNFISEKHNVNFSAVECHGKLNGSKRKIKIYTTCNSGAFDNIVLLTGKLLSNNDYFDKFMSSENTQDKNQVGKVKFFTLNSNINIYNLSNRFLNGNFRPCFFVNSNDINQLKILKKDLKNILKADIYFYPNDPDDDKFGESLKNINILINNLDASMSSEAYYLQYHAMSVLIVLYVITFITMIYWLMSRYKEIAVRQMFGMSNLEIKIKIILKELLKIHIYDLILTGLIIFGFLIYKVGLDNLSLFFKDWLIFNIVLTTISLILIFVPMKLIKYIKIPLMLKNKKPIKIIQRINYITKCLVSVATITVIINSSNSLTELLNKKVENKVWDNALNYVKLCHFKIFDDGDEGWAPKTANALKKYFQVCNKKGAIYIDAGNYEFYNGDYDLERQYNKKEYINYYKLEKYLRVNNNYLQINPIYDVNGKKINIPDHNDHTLNLLVPEKFKKYEKEIDKKYCEEFYSNNWPDYKLNIIYIKDNQRCFTYRMDLATEMQNYVTDSIIQVISNNNVLNDIYRCAPCNGFYPKIKNVDNPYQDLIKDIKECGVEGSILGAKTLYEEAAQNIYETEQIFMQKIELVIFAILLLLMVIVSTSVNYLEQNKVENMIKKIYGVGFIRRSKRLLKPMLMTWWISIFLMLMINYNGNMIDRVLYLLYLPYEMILIKMPAPGVMFRMKYMRWDVVLIMMIIDIILTLTVLKKEEKKKINKILKGE